MLESELGVAVNLTERLTLNTGWLFQSWFDLGTSGGTFGGFFSGADDSNIMALRRPLRPRRGLLLEQGRRVDSNGISPTHPPVLIHNRRDPIRLARMVNKMARLATLPSSSRPHPARPDGEGD